ncbi:MAG: Ig-like domain-containing protein, partial [Propionibacteriaceae bacterium]|nr:Ig-like domain-containing protein [Propionibacteriaceae bacterium]
MSPKTTNDTTTISAARYRRWAKPTALLTSFVLSIGSLVLGGAAAPPVANAALAGGDPVSHTATAPVWTAVTDWQANWKYELNNKNVYWAADSTNMNSSNAVGTSLTALWQADNWASDLLTYEFRATMSFTKVSSGTTNFDYLSFTSQAIGRIGGTRADPMAPLTVYYWDHFAPRSKGPASCAVGYTPIVRVTSMDPTIYWSCMPAPDDFTAGYNFTGFNQIIGNGNATGGEIDQYTGALYVISSVDGAIDNQGSNSAAQSTENNWVFSIWDPVTGAYSLSGSIQPGDWTPGMTTVPTERVDVRANVDGTGNSDPQAPADFAMDADGNVYVYSGTGLVTGNTGTTCTGSNGNMSLVRMEPARDANGNVVDGTAQNPWRYYVVDKLRKDPAATQYCWSNAQFIWGGAFVHGQFLLAANANIRPHSAYSALAQQWVGTDGGTNGTTGMVKVDPLRGTARPVWSTSNNDIPAGAATGGVNVLDDAGAQLAEVIRGMIYNDANGNGAVDPGEKGIPNVKLGLYDMSGTLVSVKQTDSVGKYSFIVDEEGVSYYVRPVQVQIAAADGTPMNATLTWAAGSTEQGYNNSGVKVTNTATVYCNEGTIATATGGQCSGAKPVGSADPPLGALDSVSSPDQWLNYAKVEINTAQQVPDVSFAFTTVGSYGDAPADPLAGPSVPAHVNGVNVPVWLGAAPGAYAGPVADITAHATDDGVFLKTFLGDAPLNAVAITQAYTLDGVLNGSQAANATVNGWLASGNTWNTTADWTPTITGGVASGPIPPFATTGDVQFRANASAQTQTQPTNASNEYYADSSGAPNWVTTGEIEDYGLTVADAVYRPAAKTTNSTGTFTVANQQIAADATKWTFGNGVPATPGSPVTVTAEVPSNQWVVDTVTVADTVTGAPVAATISAPAANGSVTITYTPTTGSDVTIAVLYAPAIDWTKSTLTLDKESALVGTPITATATVIDVNGDPVVGKVITFANVSDPVTQLSSLTCTTNDQGVCSVTITSNKTGKYPDELSATAVEAGTAKALNGSPASVEFTAGPCNILHSKFTVDPPADPTDTLNHKDWVLVGEPTEPGYTGTLTPLDEFDNLCWPDTVVFSASATTVTITGGTTANADGTYTAKFTSKVATADTTAAVAVDGAQVGKNEPIPFLHKEPDPKPTCDGKTPTNLSVNPSTTAVNTSSTATAYITDMYCNPVGEGYEVFFQASGDATMPVSAMTDKDSNAIALVTDKTAEKVLVHASLPDLADLGAEPTEINLSPQPVTFTPTDCDPNNSRFTITPVVDPADLTRTDWVTVGKPDGGSFYTGTLVPLDEFGNLCKPKAADINFQASPGFVQVGAATPNPDGTWSAKYTSTVASSTSLAWVTLSGAQVQSKLPIPFKADIPVPTCDPAELNPGMECSNLTVDPNSLDIFQKSTATVYLTDRYGNPVGAGATVVFTVNGHATFVPNAQQAYTTTTNTDSKAIVQLTDETGETVQVWGKYDGQDVKDSPADVTFSLPLCSAADSSFAIAPVADPTDPAMKNWVAAGGPNDPGYTGTLKLQSADGVAPCEPTGPIMFKSTEDYVVIGTPVDDGRGTITAKFTSTTASPDPEALVTMGGTQIGTNLPIPFKPGPYSPTCIDPSIKCSGLTVDPTNLPVGSRTTATALLTDQYGNGIGGEPIVLTVNKAATFVDNGLTTITGPTDSSWTATRGTVVVQVTDKTAETVNVAATYQGAGLPNSPVPVTFEVAPCSPEHSLFSVTPVADPADTANMVNWVTVGEPDGTNYYTGTLVPRDEYDNLCKPEAGKVVFQASPGFVMVGAPVANPNGTYSAKYTSKVAAPSAEKPAIPLAWVLLYNVQVQNKEPIPFVHDVEVVNPPEPCADPDLKATNLQVNPASVVIPGASTATAHITDKYCNAVPGVTVTFAVTDSPATTASVTGPSVTDGSGNAKSTVSDTAPETVKVHASIKQDGVDTEIRTSPQPVTFTASRVCDPAASGFAVTPAVDPADPAMTNWVTVGGPTEAGYAGTLTAKNAFGGPCDPISTAFGSTSTDVVVSDVTDNKDGTYTVKFTSTVASATPEAWAKLDGTQVGANKPIPFQAGAIDPDQSSVTANPLTQVVGSPVTVTVTLKDKYGNPVTRVAPAAVNVTGTSGPNTAIVQACVRDATQPGAYLCEMTAKVVGQYKVVAKVEGTTLSQQPVVEFVHGAVCVANCEPVDPNHLTRFDMVANDQEANGTAEDSARAWAYDHYGNVVPDAVVKVVDQSGGALTGLLNPATASALTNNTGTAMVYWTTTRSGVYTGLGTIDDLQPTTSGKDTSGGVLEIRFSPANLSAENSELVVTPASPIRVGDTYTATATIRTTTNELAKDAVVSFGVTTSVTQGWTLSSTTCRTDDNGQCSVTLTAKLVGDDYTISAKIPEAGVATNITGSPKTVAFTAGDVCVENPTTTGPDCDPLDKTHVTRLVVDPNGQEANGSAQDVINVYAYDYYGNPVPDAPVVATAPAALTLRTAVNPLTDTNGIAKVGYTATEPGQYDVPVTVGGKTPPTSPASLSFVQVPVTDLQVAITPTTTQPVGTEFTVTATATDAGGSKVKGAVITFPPVAGATVGASCTTGDDGTCTVMLYSEKPGTYTVEGRTGTLKATDKATYVAGPVDHVAVKTIKNGAMPDGTDQDIYLVTAYDKFDNPVPGATVTSANQSPELTAAAIAKTDQNGQATVAYTANKSGVYDATVKADGVTADIDPIHPTFQTLPADPGKSSWEVSPAGPIIVGKDAAN